jgi:hypothetical protein
MKKEITLIFAGFSLAVIPCLYEVQRQNRELAEAERLLRKAAIVLEEYDLCAEALEQSIELLESQRKIRKADLEFNLL